VVASAVFQRVAGLSVILTESSYLDQKHQTNLLLQRTAEMAYPLIIPGKTTVPNVGGFFVTQLIENECQIVYNNRIWCFSAAKLTAAVVRCRQPQDHFRPAGRVHGKSLKKYLTERKISAYVRDRLPLIACGSEIIWIPGVAATDDLPDLPDLPSLLNDLPACSNQLIQVRYIEPEN
jgi:tRNA(Ile)-lysidine synthetase-like protein